MADPTGPWLAAAFFCERCLQEQSGMLSPIRILDRVFFATDAEGRPLNPQHPLTLVVSLKAGDARGTFQIAVEREMPSGERGPVAGATILLEGEDRGVNLIAETAFAPEHQGLYWFDVLLDDALLTRIPLRAVFQQLPPPLAGG